MTSTSSRRWRSSKVSSGTSLDCSPIGLPQPLKRKPTTLTAHAQTTSSQTPAQPPQPQAPSLKRQHQHTTFLHAIPNHSHPHPPNHPQQPPQTLPPAQPLSKSPARSAPSPTQPHRRPAPPADTCSTRARTRGTGAARPTRVAVAAARTSTPATRACVGCVVGGRGFEPGRVDWMTGERGREGGREEGRNEGTKEVLMRCDGMDEVYDTILRASAHLAECRMAQ